MALSTEIKDLVYDDPTLNRLKPLVLNHYIRLSGNQIHLVDFVKELLNNQEKTIPTFS